MGGEKVKGGQSVLLKKPSLVLWAEGRVSSQREAAGSWVWPRPKAA